MAYAHSTSDYYPYGMQMPGADGEMQRKQPYKFGGKEHLSAGGLNIHDFGPRALYAPAGQFASADPKCEDYPHLSPYLYCAANPVNLVDPTGEDIWNLDQNGNIISHVLDGEHDTFNVYEDPNDKESFIARVQLPKGTIEFYDSNYGESKEQGIVGYDYYKVRGDKNSKKLFEFLAKVTEVEWGMVNLGEEETGPSYLATSHFNDREVGIKTLINKQLRFCYHMRTHIHSHPQAPNGEYYDYPSGRPTTKNNNTKSGDILIAQGIQSYFGTHVKFFIYSTNPELADPYINYKP